MNASHKSLLCAWLCLATRTTGVTHRVGRGGQGPEHVRWQPDGGGAEEERSLEKTGGRIWEKEEVLQVNKQGSDLQDRRQQAHSESAESRRAYVCMYVCLCVWGQVTGKGRGKKQCGIMERPGTVRTWI